MPKPDEGVAGLKTNGEGLADGAGAAEAGVEDATAPKLKVGADEFEPEPNWKGCAGAGAAEGAAGGAVWLSFCCCPNTKVFDMVSSEEEPWPNTKVLEGAGVGARVGAREEVVGVLKRVGVALDEAGVLEEELAMKPKLGFGADVSVILGPKPNDGFGGSVDSAVFPNVSVGLGKSFGGSGSLKEKPRFAVGFSASLEAPNKNALEGAEVSFFSSGFPKLKAGVTSVCSFFAGSPNFEAEDSAAKDLPKIGMEFTVVVVVVVVEAISEEAGASSFSALDWGTVKLKDEFELSFSLGLAPNKNEAFSEAEA